MRAPIGASPGVRQCEGERRASSSSNSPAPTDTSVATIFRTMWRKKPLPSMSIN